MLFGRSWSEPSDRAGASSPCRCWSAAREACGSACLLDLVDAGVGAAENAWAARACDGLDGGRSSGGRAVPWSRTLGQAADRRRRRLVCLGPVAGAGGGGGGAVVSQPRPWRRGVCAALAAGPGICLGRAGGGRAAPRPSDRLAVSGHGAGRGANRVRLRVRRPSGCHCPRVAARRMAAGGDRDLDVAAQLRWPWVCAVAVSRREAAIAALAAGGLDAGVVVWGSLCVGCGSPRAD